MMKQIAYGFVSIGFIVAALVSVMDVDELQWIYYAFGLGFGIVGVIIIRSHMKKLWTAPDKLSGNMTLLMTCLTRIVETAQQYQGKAMTDATCLSMHQTIDQEFASDLRQFADARESIVHLHGLQTYAEIMTHFATGERYLNRVWSASADGYVDEVSLYMPQVLEQFQQCHEKLSVLSLKS